LLEAFEGSGFAFGDCFEALGGACGWGESVACGAWDDAVFLLLDEPSVTELLFRRSPPFFLKAFFDPEDAFLLHADNTATVTLCWT